jgi:GT2 family glycosyltransferase
MEPATVSAIIPTKNRPRDLQLTVRTLLEQTVLPREVIIVDQSLGQDSRVAVETEFRSAARRCSFLPALKYAHEASITGVSAARNHAMTIASEAVWLFLDDDVIIEPDFIEELMQVYSAHRDVAGVSGVITNYAPFSFIYRAWLRIFARGPFQETRLPIYWRADQLRDSGLIRVAGFSGGLMSFRASVARLGRFDTRIRDAEDLDFCLNLAGNPVLVITPKARLQHVSSPVGRAQDLWVEKLAASQSFLYQKNWRDRMRNRMYFAWLCVGLGLAATVSGLRRFSLKPWRATLAGMRKGYDTANAPPLEPTVTESTSAVARR